MIEHLIFGGFFKQPRIVNHASTFVWGQGWYFHNYLGFRERFGEILKYP
jgi:hypothetical protein